MKAKATIGMPAVADDWKWQAESDARTLTEAEQVRMDKARHGRAVKALKAQAKVSRQEATIKTQLAKGGTQGLAKAFSKLGKGK